MVAQMQGGNSGTFSVGPNLGKSCEVVDPLDHYADDDDIIFRNTSTGSHVAIDMNNGDFAGFDSESQALGKDWMLVRPDWPGDTFR